MTHLAAPSVVERWDIHPELGWLRGRRPEPEVQYDERMNAWCVYGYPEVSAIISDPKGFSNRTAQLAAVQIDASFTEGDLTQMDAPEHSRFRKIIATAFTARVVAGLQRRIVEVTDQLLDEVAQRAAGGAAVDLVAGLAYPLPVIVIADLLGIPNEDRDMFMAHSTNVIDQMNGLSFLDSEQEQDIGYALEQFMPMVEYMREQAERRRIQPGDDLLSTLATAQIDGRGLTDNEIVNLANILLGAGHITTTMLIGNAILCLDANPEQLERVRADRSLLNGALEEVLRTLSPSAALSRRTTTDVEVAGVRIPAEQMILPWPAAANRDPRAFPDPDVFDIDRTPNHHLGFGHGVHYCIGSQLAKLEGRIALDRLLDRFQSLEISSSDSPVIFPTQDLIGVRSLPARLG